MAPKKTRNPVYEHYSAIEGDDKRMQCSYCSTTVTKLSSNLETHLKTQHKSIFSEHGKGKEELLLQKRKAGETSQSAAKQRKITPFFGKSLIMSPCVGLVVENGRPFSIFKDQHAVALIQLAKGNVGETIEIYPEAVKKAASQQSQAQKNPEALQLEFAEYDKLLRLAPGEQVMEFWKAQEQLPLIKEIATDIILIPVTEVTVERMFSHLTFILNRYRSTLKVDLLEDIMFLRLNKKFQHLN